MHEVVVDFKPFGNTLKLQTNDPFIGSIIDNLYTNFIKPQDSTAESRNESIFSCLRINNHYEIHRNGDKIERDDIRDRVIMTLNELIMHKYFFIREQYWSVHAGVVHRNGRTVLFIGNSGSGKSTLTALLSLNGCDYFSDDIAVIRCSDLNVIPCPTTIKLREPVIQRYPVFSDKIQRQVYIPGKKGKRWMYNPVVQSAWRSTAEKVNAIVCVNFHEKQTISLKQLNKMTAVKKLLLNSFSNCNMQHNREISVKLADSIPVYELHYSAFEEAFDLLKEKLFKG